MPMSDKKSVKELENLALLSHVRPKALTPGPVYLVFLLARAPRTTSGAETGDAIMNLAKHAPRQKRPVGRATLQGEALKNCLDSFVRRLLCSHEARPGFPRCLCSCVAAINPALGVGLHHDPQDEQRTHQHPMRAALPSDGPGLPAEPDPGRSFISVGSQWWFADVRARHQPPCASSRSSAVYAARHRRRPDATWRRRLRRPRRQPAPSVPQCPS